MFQGVLQDLVKPHWLAIFRELMLVGSSPVPPLAAKLGLSYMTIRQHCEDLTAIGYLKRTRLPRSAIGRPEISYRLTRKARQLFPAISENVLLKILEKVQNLYGQTAADRVLLHYFQDKEQAWRVGLEGVPGLISKVEQLLTLRAHEGILAEVIWEGGQPRIREYHHPLQSVFEQYPCALRMEVQAMSGALGVAISRLAHAHATDFLLPVNEFEACSDPNR